MEDICWLGIDEKSFESGHRYVGVLTDIKGRRVLEVMPGADIPSAQRLLATLSEAPQRKVPAVAMDRSPAFISAVEQSLPHADIVHDAYHLAADLGKVIDKVRRPEHAELSRQGDPTLKGTRFLWLSDPHNLDQERLHSFVHFGADRPLCGR